jgi:hypothetical protein
MRNLEMDTDGASLDEANPNDKWDCQGVANNCLGLVNRVDLLVVDVV